MPKKPLLLQAVAGHKRRIIGVSKGVVNDLRSTLKVLIFPSVLGLSPTSLFPLERLYIVAGVRLFAVRLQTFQQTLTIQEANKPRPMAIQRTKAIPKPITHRVTSAVVGFRNCVCSPEYGPLLRHLPVYP